MLLVSDGTQHMGEGGKKTPEIFSYQAHVTPVPFKLPPSLLFTIPFTVATNYFKQKCQTPQSVLYDHHMACQMDVNSKDETFSMRP